MIMVDMELPNVGGVGLLRRFGGLNPRVRR